MELRPGTRLGPYEIVSPLGAGGMGEVYRAVDTRLQRLVAVKVLPPGLASDADRLKRFEREARSASALNHPNIITILDVGSVDSTSFIAMELVDGKTLREALSAGPLPVRKVLEIGAQVASGLAAAHEASIVHRDLKPENIMLRADGFAKILDFGLAKLTHAETTDGMSALKTVSTATEAGIVMGTVGYMSPEQASGQKTDFRSDQFALGAILYEMATGQRAFYKATAAETLTAIIREEPKSIAAINAKVPAPLRWIAERCLSKEASERYASTGDLARELRTLYERLSEITGSGEVAPQPAGFRLRTLAAVLIAVAAIGGAFLAGRSSRSGFSSLTFHQLTFRPGGIGNAHFAPDGKTVVYDARWEGTDADDPTPNEREIFSTRPESPESRPFGLKGAWICAVSASDELAIVFGEHRLGTLAQVPMSGGAPREVLEKVYAAAWAPDGSLAVVRRIGGKSRLEWPIGKTLYETAAGIERPLVTAKGGLVRFSAEGHLMEVDRNGKTRVLGTEDAGDFVWAPSGEEVFTASVSGTTTEIRAVTFAGKRRRMGSLPGDWALHDVSRDGRLLMERIVQSSGIVGLAPGERHPRNLGWLDHSVAEDLSADGKTLLFNDRGPGESGAAYLRRMDGSPPIRLGDGYALAFSPDAKWVLTLRAGNLVLVPRGPGEARSLPRGNVHPQEGASWSRDGRRILFVGNQPGRPARVWVQDVDSGEPRPVTVEGTLWKGKALSPDGKWFVDEQGNLQSVDGGAPRPLSGLLPEDRTFRFSADGRALIVGPGAGSLHRKRISRLDLTTGKRELLMEVVPRQPLGGGGIADVHVADDEKAWAYSFSGVHSELYVVDGLR